MGSKDSKGWQYKEKCLTFCLLDESSGGVAILKDILPPTLAKKPFFLGLQINHKT